MVVDTQPATGTEVTTSAAPVVEAPVVDTQQAAPPPEAPPATPVEPKAEAPSEPPAQPTTQQVDPVVFAKQQLEATNLIRAQMEAEAARRNAAEAELERVRQEATAERERLTKELSDKHAAELAAREKQLAEIKFDAEVKVAAAASGAVDLDFVLFKARTAAGADMASFDASTFVTGLRKTNPAAFSSAATQAPTPTTTGASMPAPAPQQAPVTDVKTLPLPEYEAAKRRAGYSDLTFTFR